VFFEEQSVEALATALVDPALDGAWDTATMVEHARGFDRDRFRSELEGVLSEAWRRHTTGPVRGSVPA